MQSVRVNAPLVYTFYLSSSPKLLLSRVACHAIDALFLSLAYPCFSSSLLLNENAELAFEKLN